MNIFDMNRLYVNLVLLERARRGGKFNDDFNRYQFERVSLQLGYDLDRGMRAVISGSVFGFFARELNLPTIASELLRYSLEQIHRQVGPGVDQQMNFSR